MPNALRSHLVGFVFLLPFLAMLGLHRLLGLSDALMGAPALEERDAQLYNFVMVFVFYGGVTAYFIHALAIAYRSKEWLAFKLLFLVAFWVGILQLA